MTQLMQFVSKFQDFNPAVDVTLSDASIAQVITNTEITGDSILMTGNRRTTTIPDIIKLGQPIEVTIDPTAHKDAYHFCDAPLVLLTITEANDKAKVITLPSQRVYVRNVSSSSVRVYPRRAGVPATGTNAVQHLGASISLGPFEERWLLA